MAQLRPNHMRVEIDACIECGLCEEISPGIRDCEELIPVNRSTLEAMASCPTGAIRWSEGELSDEASRCAHYPSA